MRGIVALALVVLAVAGACSSDDDTSSAPASTSAPSVESVLDRPAENGT